MKTQVFLLFVLVIVLAAPGMQCGMPLNPVRQADFSGFSQFTLSQGGALGYCPSLPFTDVTINRTEDGTYVAVFTVVEQGQGGVDDCRWDLVTNECRYGSITWEDGNAWDLYVTDDAAADTSSNQPPASDCDCPVVRELPGRQLTDAEAIRLLEVFSAVTIVTEDWSSICIDGCLVEEVRWDDYEASSPMGCMTGLSDNLDKETWTAIHAVLEEIYQNGNAGSGA